MKKKAFWGIMILVIGAGMAAGEDIHSSLKKIYFFNSVERYSQATEVLQSVDLQSVSRQERQQVVDHLFRIGDSLHRQGKDDIARQYYLKIVREFPQYWYAYNRIEFLRREGGGPLISLQNSHRQMMSMLRSFESIYLFISVLLNSFFFASLLVFFTFALLMFIRYIRLFANDVLITAHDRLSQGKLGIFLLLMLWPLLFGFSWAIFPFLIYGLLWGYISGREKKIIFVMWVVIMAAVFLHGFNTLMEQRFQSEDFKHVQMTYYQKTYDRETVENFSDELKMLQAWVHYNNGDYQQSLEVISLSGDSFRSKLKYDLLGVINYQFGNLNDSLNFLNRSLEIDDHDPVTLNNFTLVLLQEGDESILRSYEQRFPRIRDIKNRVSSLQKPRIKRSHFWRALFNFAPGRSFSLFRTVKAVVVEYLKNPVIYYVLISLLYFFLLRFLDNRYGESVNCSKCHKILKKSKMHRSYDICDDCYQLFFLKDVIFLEAKSIKSRELAKKSKRMFLLGLIISIFIPGFLFYIKKKHFWFVLSLWIFSYFLLITVVGNYVFRTLYGLSPLVINLLGVFGLALYLVINITSILGENDGA